MATHRRTGRAGGRSAASSDLRLALVGFGGVGRRFAELLRGPYGRILRGAGCRARITAIATARHGCAVDPAGLRLDACLRLVRADRSIAGAGRGTPPRSTLELIRRAPADVLVELTPLDPRAGQPALGHVRAALRRGLHVVTANKGPVAFELRRLKRAAARRGVAFLHEGAVMDGTPIFNMVERCLPGTRILGFRGVLNSTTTRILQAVEQGADFRTALKQARAAGITEADPSHDLEGWDAAVKGCVLANALMGADVRPTQVRRRGIVGLRAPAVRRVARLRHRMRLVTSARRIGRRVQVEVAPVSLPAGDLLAVEGADGVVALQTDLMGEVGIFEGPGGIDQTAYAVLSDLLRIVGGWWAL